VKLILLNNSSAKPVTISLNSYIYGAASFAIFSIIGLILYAGILLGRPDSDFMDYHERISPYSLSTEVYEEKKNLEKTREYVERNLEALSARVGSLQAQVSRINAVEKRLARAAKVDLSVFDFDSEPAIGGGDAEKSSSKKVDGTSLSNEIQSLESALSNREAAIQSLGVSLSEILLREEQTPDGMPVKNSWISSRYGWRSHPVSGRKQFHKGVDIPGKHGADIISVADGVVVRSQSAGLLGNIVEINHGDGLRTIYAHNSKNLVAVGQAVKKGDVIAEVGSTGRSTGPHVHFEVRKHGKPISPHSFLR